MNRKNKEEYYKDTRNLRTNINPPAHKSSWTCLSDLHYPYTEGCLHEHSINKDCRDRIFEVSIHVPPNQPTTRLMHYTASHAHPPTAAHLYFWAQLQRWRKLKEREKTAEHAASSHEGSVSLSLSPCCAIHSLTLHHRATQL